MPERAPGPVGHEARHHHALLQHVGEDAQPGPLRAADHAAEAHELLLVAAVVLARDGERAARDLVQVQRDDAHHLAAQREERPAPEARIGRARHDAAIEQVLPVGLELAEVGHEPAGHPALAGPGGADREDGLAARERVRVADGDGRQALPLHAEQREPDLEVLRDDLGLQRAASSQGDLDGLGAHDHVVHGEDEAGGIHDRAGAHPLIAHDAGGGMARGDLGVDVHHRAEQMLDDLDRRVHELSAGSR